MACIQPIIIPTFEVSNISFELNIITNELFKLRFVYLDKYGVFDYVPHVFVQVRETF